MERAVEDVDEGEPSLKAAVLRESNPLVSGIAPTPEYRDKESRMEQAASNAQVTGILYDVEQERIDQADRIGKLLGKKIFFFSENPTEYGIKRAVYDPAEDSIGINVKSKSVMAASVGHELTHSLEAATSYESLKNLIFERIGETGGDLTTLRKEKQELYNQNGERLSQEQIDREIVAEYVEKHLLTDEESIRRLVRDDRSIARRILDWLDSLLAKIGNRKSQEREFVRETRDIYRKALAEANEKRGLWRLYEQAKKAYAEGDDETGDYLMDQVMAAMPAERLTEDDFERDDSSYDDELLYSISRTKNKAQNHAQADVTARFQKTVDQILNMQNTKPTHLVIGYTPDVFAMLGMPSLPFTIGTGHVYSAAKTEAEARQDGNYRKGTHYHGLGAAAIKNIYDSLQDPVAIIASKDVNKKTAPMRSTHSIVAIVEIGSGAKSLLLPVEVTAERTVNGVRMDVNTLSSVYEKDAGKLMNEAIALENSGGIGIYYAKKEAMTLPAAGVQFPIQLQQSIASGGIVHKLGEKVNMNVADATQSQQFKRWFGDWQNHPEQASRVVNADGTPKLMYHGTRQENGDFWVFDETKAVRKGGLGFKAMGKGNYFTAKRLDGTERYGSRVLAVYLNIRNPFVYNGGSSFREQLQEMLGIDAALNADQAQQEMRKQGYDGVIQYDRDGEVSIAVAFDSNQIKSATDNLGTFDGGNPDIRYSFGGVNASGADMAALERAKEMLEAGESMTGIFRQTGWYQGADGKWRFEIDDSRMKYRPSGDARFRKDHPEYARFRELEGKFINCTITGEEITEMAELRSMWGNEPKRLAEQVARGNAWLQDVLEHDALYERYPRLRRVRVRFGDTDNAGAWWDKGRNEIVVSERYRQADPAFLELKLLHEIQHAIGDMEGFAGGANPEYWQEIQDGDKPARENDAAIAKAEQDAQKALTGIPPEVAKDFWYAANMRENDPEGADEISDRLDESEYAEAWWDYAWAIGTIQELMERENPVRTATDLYRNTAGEIEARDAANRRGLDPEARKNRLPDTGDERTVFVEGSVWSAAVGENETSIKDQLAANADRLNAMEPVVDRVITERFKSKKAAKQWAIGYLKATGYRVDRQGYGTIYFNEADINYGLNYSDTIEEQLAIAAIPQVLKRGVVIGEHGNHKMREKATITFGAPVVLNGTRVNIAVVVERRGNHYYTHRVVLPDGKAFRLDGGKKKNVAQEAHRGVLPEKSLADATSATSTDNVPDSERDVKRYSIDENMTEAERYEELKNRTVAVIADHKSGSYADELGNIDALPGRAKSKVEKIIKPLAVTLGILNRDMQTPDLEIRFQFSGNKGLAESLHKQLRYGGSYTDFAKALIHLDEILENAVLIERHGDKYKNTTRADENLKGVYVLFGALDSDDGMIPVQMEIKESADAGSKLYMTVAMTKIEAGVVGSTPGVNQARSLLPASTYRLADIFAEIKPLDNHFLKYIPDGFLDDAQIRAKYTALEEDARRIAGYGKKKYSISPPEEMTEAARAAKLEGYPVLNGVQVIPQSVRGIVFSG